MTLITGNRINLKFIGEDMEIVNLAPNWLGGILIIVSWHIHFNKLLMPLTPVCCFANLVQGLRNRISSVSKKEPKLKPEKISLSSA